jgi:hypothetical protein
MEKTGLPQLDILGVSQVPEMLQQLNNGIIFLVLLLIIYFLDRIYNLFKQSEEIWCFWSVIGTYFSNHK